jgi:hypothetical protein
MDGFYAAVVQAVEEAVLNALVAGRDTIGRAGHFSPACPANRCAGASPPVAGRDARNRQPARIVAASAIR